MKKSLFTLSLSALWILSQVPIVGAAGIGVVTGIRGEATVRHEAVPQAQTLKFKDDVQWQDTLNTGADARLRLLILQKSVITMKEQSQLQLREEAVSPTQPKKKSVLNLLSGSIRAVVEKDALKDSDFEVHTNLAVAAIRGSDLIGERTSSTEASFFTGPGATATVIHTNPAIGTQDLAELSRARVLPTGIEITRITLDQFRSLAAATAPKGAQASGHRASATLASVETRAVSQAVTETVRAVIDRGGVGALTGGGGAGGGPGGTDKGPDTRAPIVPSATSISSGVTVLGNSDFTSAISTSTFTETFTSATDSKSYDVVTSGTKWFVSTKDCCISGDKWKATISHSGKELTSVTGTGSTTSFSDRTGVSSTGSKSFIVKVTYTTGVDSFAAGMDVKFDTTAGSITATRKSTGGS